MMARSLRCAVSWTGVPEPPANGSLPLENPQGVAAAEFSDYGWTA